MFRVKQRPVLTLACAASLTLLEIRLVTQLDRERPSASASFFARFFSSGSILILSSLVLDIVSQGSKNRKNCYFSTGIYLVMAFFWCIICIYKRHQLEGICT